MDRKYFASFLLIFSCLLILERISSFRAFVKYNIVSGIFASILAILMLTGALYYLQNELKGFIQILDMQTLLLVYVAVFALGIVLSVIATIFAVNKYLRMGVDKLYYI